MSKEDNETPLSLHSRNDRYVDEATQKRIHEHLADPNSKITDEDIANVNTDIFRRPDTEDETKVEETELDEDRYIDLATQKRIHEHLADPNSKITEEDIANVNTDIFRRPATEEEKKGEKDIDESLPPKAGSAWEVLD